MDSSTFSQSAILKAEGFSDLSPIASESIVAQCNSEGVAIEPIESEPITPKRGAGRPKGSKNKPKRGRPKKSKIGRVKPPQQSNSVVKWEQYVVSTNDDVEGSNPLLTIGERLLVSAGGIATISGKPKSYKTFFVSAIVGSFLRGDYMGIKSLDSGNDSKVLLCDTEQGRERTQRVAKRIEKICALPTEEFNRRMQALSIRELNHKERSKVIKSAIYSLKPKLVVIDGIRDLIRDFNSISESGGVVDLIMKAASDIGCAVIVVIHLNKGDANIRGHLGAELCNKSETVITLKSERDEVVRVSPTHCRDVSFEEFAFRVSEDGIPIACNLPVKTEIDKTEKLKALAHSVFDENDTLGRKELLERIAELLGKTQKTAERRIKNMVDCGILQYNSNNSYTLIN